MSSARYFTSRLSKISSKSTIKRIEDRDSVVQSRASLAINIEDTSMRPHDFGRDRYHKNHASNHSRLAVSGILGDVAERRASSADFGLSGDQCGLPAANVDIPG